MCQICDKLPKSRAKIKGATRFQVAPFSFTQDGLTGFRQPLGDAIPPSSGRFIDSNQTIDGVTVDFTKPKPSGFWSPVILNFWKICFFFALDAFQLSIDAVIFLIQILAFSHQIFPFFLFGFRRLPEGSFGGMPSPHHQDGLVDWGALDLAVRECCPGYVVMVASPLFISTVESDVDFGHLRAFDSRFPLIHFITGQFCVAFPSQSGM